ncbi:MAG: hypothetical protein HZA46_08765, partial [Planctomycetales bacterium]|nr:hypothetical protein [Planctomycetales bacterium]
GRAMDEHLRFEEMARTRAVLTGTCSVSLPDGASDRMAATALLIASTNLVERIGGKRRRGGGRCKLDIIEITNVEMNAALDWLESNSQAPGVPRPSDSSLAAWIEASPTDTSEWISIPLLLELASPLAVSSRTVGNVAESLDFVPGTYLLPHVTAAFAGLGMDVRPAIARGDLRVLPATIDVGGQAGWPVPLALFLRKEQGSFADRESLRNRLVEPEQTNEPQFKQCRGGYVGTAEPDTLPSYVTVPLIVRTHNTVEEESQRPTTEVGGVYSYEAIATKRLRTELRLRKSLYEQLTSKPDWRRAIEGSCRFGRSKKDDYGAVVLSVADPHSVPGARPCQDNRLAVWLLSDVLLRDKRLRAAPTIESLGNELGRRLGVKLTSVIPLVRVRRTESWHVGWGLPRASLVTLNAGSCVLFAVDSEPALDKLNKIEAEGIGERTSEGYGQVRFNNPLLLIAPNTLKPARNVATSTTPPAVPLLEAEETYEYACRIEEEAWREEIRRAALTAAQVRQRELLGWDAQREQPPMSQIGGLRGVLQLLQSWDNRAMVIGWLEHLRDTKRREEKWPGNSLQRLVRLLREPQAVWEVLEPAKWPTLTEHAGERLRTKLWAVAVRSLIDACIRAHKRELDERQTRRH